MLSDMLKKVSEPGKTELAKDLDLFLTTTYVDQSSIARGHGDDNLHPSSMSGCLRAKFYEWIGAPEKSPWDGGGRSQRIFGNGDKMHERFQEYYAKMGVLWGSWRCHGCQGYGECQVTKDIEGVKVGTGCKILDCTIPECPRGFSREWTDPDQPIKPRFYYVEPGFFIEELRVKGHTDGIIIGKDKRHILELKSMKQEYWQSLIEPKPEHIDQAQIYCGAFGCDGIIFQYESKNTQEIKEFIVPADPAKYEEMLQKARTFWACLEQGTLPNKVCRTVAEGRWCAFKEYCFTEFTNWEELWREKYGA